MEKQQFFSGGNVWIGEVPNGQLRLDWGLCSLATCFLFLGHDLRSVDFSPKVFQFIIDIEIQNVRKSKGEVKYVNNDYLPIPGRGRVAITIKKVLRSPPNSRYPYITS